jgi:hypothetical protein
MKVSDRSAKELALLRDQPSTKIAEVLSQLSAAKKPIVSPRVMRSLFEKSLEKEAARVLVKQLIALGNFVRECGVQPAVAIESLTLGLQSHWTATDISQWNAFAPQLQKLLESNHVAILEKALNISFDFEHIYPLATLRDLCSARPASPSVAPGSLRSFTDASMPWPLPAFVPRVVRWPFARHPYRLRRRGPLAHFAPRRGPASGLRRAFQMW